MYIIQNNLIIYKKRGVVLPRGGVRTGAGRPKGKANLEKKPNQYVFLLVKLTVL